MNINGLKNWFSKLTTLFFCLFLSSSTIFAQQIISPLIKDKSHESLNISNIIINDSSTIVTVKFSSKNDSLIKLCLNKSAYIKESKNDFKRQLQVDKTPKQVAPKKYSLIKPEGIPYCQAKENGKHNNDSLEFVLTFEKLDKPLYGFIDLITENFQFEGICLNDSLAYEVSTYQNAFSEFEAGNKDTAILLFKKIIDFHDTINNMYENSFFNIPVIYESNGDKKKAITWYKKLVESELKDDEILEEESKIYANYKHRSCLRLAAIYKSMSKFEESLKYIWLADTVHVFHDTSAVARNKQNALLLIDKIQAYDSLKEYSNALFYGIRQIINEETPNIYNAHSKMLVDIIKRNYDYKKFTADFDKALQELIVFDKENQVIGKFKFLEQDYELSINKDYTILSMDNKSKQLVKAGIQDKNQAFFIQRVKISDFYLKLKTKN